MAITATQQTDIIKAVVGVFNASPGGYMSTLAAAVQAGTSTAQLYDALASNAAFKSLSFAYSDGATNAQFASALASNMLGNSVSAANLQLAKDFVVTNLNANVSKGAIIKGAVDFLSSMSKTDANWGGAATLFANKVTVATAYTIDQSGSATSVAALLATVATVDTTQASVDNAIAVNSGATYALAAGATSYNEGDTAMFTLTTTNVVSGTELAYTVSGVSAGDVTGALTGKVTVSQGSATISVVTNRDFTTEGAETMKVALDNGKTSATATVADTSTTPTYTVAADAASANEGAKATFTVTSDQTVPDGTTVAYTISGVDAKDTTTALTGNATFTGGKAAISVDLTNDATTEGAETLSVKVGTTTATTTVADTSLTPVLAADTFQVAPGVAGQVAAKIDGTTLLANDVGSDGKVLTGTVSVVAGSEVNGTTSLDSGGFILFSPAVGATSGSFKYAVSGVTETGTVNVLFNTSPVASDGTLAVTEGTQGSGAVTATDADAGQTLTYAVVTAATKGTVTLNAATGAYTYDYTGGKDAVKGALAAAATATDTFTFTATDSMGAVSGAKTVTVTATGVEDGPQLISPAPADLSVKSGSTTTIKLTDYATDPDTATSKLTFTPDAASALNGTVTNNNDGTVSFVTGAGSGALGADSFSFTVTDGTTPVTTKINVGVTNSAPTATAFSLSAKTGVTQTVDLTGKVSDAESNTLTPAITVGSVSSGGSAEVLAGKIVYTSTIGFVGTETVKYTVTDGFGGTSAEQTISFTVASNTGGTSGNDLLYGATVAENIDGLAGNDTIVGGGGLDTITGGDGNDIVTFSDGAAQVQGGAGNDTLVVNSDAVAATFELSDSANHNQDASSKNANGVQVVVRSFENIDASKSSGDFTLNADNTFNTTYNGSSGEFGDALLTTSVKTGSGNDKLNFGVATGTVTVQTNDGDDFIYVNNDGTGDNATGKFSIEGGAGIDTINVTSTTVAHTILGGAGNDVITDGTGTTSVDGGDGDDSVTGGTGQETLLGSAGNDTISSGGGNDSILGGDGNDSLTAGAGTDSLWGGAGNDTLVASTDADYLIGEAGDDTFTMAGNLTGGSTGDTITGGDGTDTVSVTGIADAATFSVSTYTKATGIEAWNVTGAAGASFTVAAGSAAGLTGITYNEVTGTAETLSVTGLTTGAAVTLVSTTDAQTIGVVTISKTDATATTDSLSVNLKGLAAGPATSVVDSLVLTGYESVTIDSGATSSTALVAARANVVTTIDDVDLKTLTLTGASVLTISGMTAAAAPTAVNAGAMTGVFNYTTAVASNVALTGGSGNDTFALGTTLNNSDTIDGGAGTGDTLTATVTSATATTGALRISNVEKIDLTEAGTSTVDATNISGGSLNFAGGSTALTITKLAATQAIGLGFAGTATAHTGGTVTPSLADATGTADSLTINLQSTGTTAATLVTSGIETVTLAAAAEMVNTGAISLIGVTAAKLVVSGTLTDTTKILDTDGAALSTSTTTVDASGYTGGLQIQASASGTTISMKSGNANDSILGGAGNDTVTYATLGTTAEWVTGGAGTNDTLTITSLTGALNATNITTFENINIGIASGNVMTPAAYNGLVTSDVLNIVVTGGGTTDGVASTLTINTGFHTNLKKFDASGYSGAVTLTNTTDDTGADSTITIAGGSGASDVLTVDYAAAATYVPVISGFETVRIIADSNNSGAETHGFNLASVTGATTAVAFATSTTGNTVVNVTNYDGSTTLQLGHAVAGAEFDGASTLDVQLVTSTGSTDVLNLKLVDTAGAADTSTVTGTGFETINVNAGASTSTENHTISLSGVTTTSSAAQTVNVTGGMSNVADGTILTIASVNASATVINASSYIGSLVVSDRGSSAMTITGGTGDDTLRMENTSDVLDGGTQTTGLAASNGDTLSIALSSLLASKVDLSAADQLVSIGATANTAVQQGFENVNASGYLLSGIEVTGSSLANIIVGSAQGDLINGGAAADTITGGAGADDLTGGAGADTFVYTTVADSNAVTSAAMDTIQDVVLNAAAGDLFDFTLTGVLTVATSASGAANVAAADSTAELQALFNSTNGTAGTDFTAGGNATALLVTNTDGTKMLVVDVNGDGTFTAVDVAIVITGVTVTSFTTACFV